MTLLDTLDPIFADCLGENDRFALAEPWIRKGFVYATNGSIVMRQPTQSPETSHRGPQCGDAFDENKPTGKAIPLPDIGPELGDRAICEQCKGKDSTKTCDMCKGTGKHVCPTCKHEKPCRACVGQGSQYCFGCGGEGWNARKRVSVKLRPRHEVGLADYYIWLLRRHEIKAVRLAADGLAFCFRKGKIEGIVMGMNLGLDDDG